MNSFKLADHSIELSTRNVIVTEWTDLSCSVDMGVLYQARTPQSDPVLPIHYSSERNRKNERTAAAIDLPSGPGAGQKGLIKRGCLLLV
jgi:hypothetical protein